MTDSIKKKYVDFMSIKKGDLIYHEGPLLSHFEGDDGNQYFFKWADSNKSINRWLVFQVTNSELMLFFNKKITLKDLILNEWKQAVYLLDIDSDLNLKKVVRKKMDRILEAYLPVENSYYDAEQYEEYAQILGKNIKTNKLKSRTTASHEIKSVAAKKKSRTVLRKAKPKTKWVIEKAVAKQAKPSKKWVTRKAKVKKATSSKKVSEKKTS